MVAKIFVGIATATTILYLVFLAIILALGANNSSWMEGYELMFSIMPFILVADFLFRFVAQQTPTQLIHPYLLLPMPKNTCIESFVIFSILNWGNATWLALFVPYAIMSVLFQTGILCTLSFLIALQLFIFLNSLWYMLCRTLINSKILWWALPLAVYAIVFLPLILKDFGYFFEFYAHLGEWFTYGNPLAYLALLAAIALLFFINLKVQGHFIYNEVTGQDGRSSAAYGHHHQNHRRDWRIPETRGEEHYEEQECAQLFHHGYSADMLPKPDYSIHRPL